MRLVEVLSAPRRVVASKRFMKELPPFLRVDPKVGSTLAAFLRFRETALPQQGFNKKDAVYTGGNLKGLRHVHLVHGKVILTYQITHALIVLISVHDHDATEGNGRSLKTYADSLTAGDLMTFGSPEDDRTGPSEAERAKMRADVADALYDLASHPQDREMLILTCKGEYVPEMWEMLRVMIGLGEAQDEDRRIVTAFDGLARLTAKIRDVLNQTG